MGNLCSTKNLPSLASLTLTRSQDPRLGNDLEVYPHSLRRGSISNEPVTVPSLFDICLEQLCLSLVDNETLDNLSARRHYFTAANWKALEIMLSEYMHERWKQEQQEYRVRTNSISSSSISGYPHHHTLRNNMNVEDALSPLVDRAFDFLPKRLLTPRSRSFSVTSKETPELGPLTPLSQGRQHSQSISVAPLSLPSPAVANHIGSPHLVSSIPPTPTCRPTRLPDLLLQFLFDRLVQMKLLSFTTCKTFSEAQLSHINLGKYPGLTNEWVYALLSGIPYNSTSQGMFDNILGIDDATVGERRLNDGFAGSMWNGASDASSVPKSSILFSMRSGNRIHLNNNDGNNPSSDETSEASQDSEFAGILGETGDKKSNIINDKNDSNGVTLLMNSPILKSIPYPPSSSIFHDSFTLNSSMATSLVHVDFRKCDSLTDHAIMPLILCNKITYLNLEGCPAISNEFTTAFLPMKRSLTYLNLSTCRSIDDQTLLMLSQQKPPLHALLLDSTKITDKGLSLLSFLSDLEVFSAGWNGKRVTSEGLHWLSNCHQLRQLCVCNTGVTKISKYAACKKLNILNLSKTKIAHDKESFRTKVPFPNLEQIIMQRCETEQIPSILLSPSLNVVDLSFSSIKSSTIAIQLESFVPPDSIKSLVKEVNDDDDLFDIPVEIQDSETVIEYDGFRSVDPQINSPSTRSTVLSPATPNRNNRCEPEEDCISCNGQICPSHFACNSRHHSIGSKFSPILSVPYSSSTSPSVYNLRILKLESCAIGDDVMKVVGKLASLTELNISDTPITNEGLSHLSSLKSLVSLNLNGCKINNHALVAIANLVHLKELRLDCPNINDGALTHLSNLKELETLDLFEAHVTDSGFEFLVPLTSLKSFQACCGRLTNGALKTLSQIESLTSLNLSQNRYITDFGLRYLSRLQCLTHVNLSGCGITQHGLASLQSLSSIKTVSLFGCKIRPSSSKLKELPPGIQLGVDEGIVAID